MNRMSRKIEYSLMALKFMTKKALGELTTAKEVSDALHTPFDATARVMQVMAQKGLLKSEQGAFGGYQIAKDLAKVSLLDLIQFVEGPTALVKCLQSEEPCEIRGQCNIVSPIQTLNVKMKAFYQSLSLKEILFEKSEKTKSNTSFGKTVMTGDRSSQATEVEHV
jgi:Rrf2 family nitric oxide-sensitive transcriptional repressor